MALASDMLFLVSPLTKWHAELLLVVAEPGSAVSLRRLPEEFLFPLCVAARAVRTWKYQYIFP